MESVKKYFIMAAKYSKLKSVVLHLVFLSPFFSCQNIHQEEYDWLPTVGAPKEYAIKILSGEFISNHGYSPQLPQSDFDNSGWGDIGGVMVVGPDKKPVPDSLKVTWLSFAENKYYRGSFALPTEKIRALLKTGYQDHDPYKRMNYHYLTLGFSPGGNIVLWLSGGVRQIEVAAFKADQIKIKLQDFSPDDRYLLKDNYINETYVRNVPAPLRDSIAKKGIQYNIFIEWQRKYSWHYSVNSASVKFYHLQVTYFNEESELIFDEVLLHHSNEEKAVPKSIYVVWFDKKKQKMSTEIVFDEQEIRSAFAKLGTHDKGELFFKVDPNEYTVAVSFKINDLTIKLTKMKAKTSLLPE